MDRKELIEKLYNIYWSSGEAISGMNAIADYFLSNTSQLRDENASLRKDVEALKEDKEKALVFAIERNKVVGDIRKETEELRGENERLKALVESVEIALQGDGYHYEQVEEALSKIAEFK